MPEDLSASIMSQLPRGGPGLYRRIGSLVLQAWTDVALREALRQDALATLTREGLQLPPEMTVHIVAADEARLPTADTLALPLPPPDAPPVASDEAECQLSATPFRYLLGDAAQIASLDAYPESQPAAAPGSGVAARAVAWSQSVVGGLALPHPVSAGGAAVVLLAASALVAARHWSWGPGDSLAGLAGGAATGTAIFFVALVALVVGALAARRL